MTAYGDLWPAARGSPAGSWPPATIRPCPGSGSSTPTAQLAVGERQRRLLEAEEVPFRRGRVRMDIARVPAEALDELIEQKE